MTRHVSPLRLFSKVDSVRKLMLYALPTKPTDVALIVRTENVTVAVSSAGRLYTSQVESRRPYMRGKGLTHTLTCLKKLGVLTEAAIKEHDKIEADDTAARQRKSSAHWILEEAGRAGLKLSPKQRAYLQEQSGASDDI